MFCDSDWENLR